MKYREVVVGCLLMLGAAGASALSLGRVSGAVLLGRPMDLRVPVRLEDVDDATQLCLEADVFHADTRISPSRVQVMLEPGASSQQAVLRIRSSAPVDEPMVTVYLQAGCQQRVSRRYVLLSEVPPDGAVAAPEPAQALAVASNVTSNAAPVTTPANAASRAASAPPVQPPANTVAAAVPLRSTPAVASRPRAEAGRAAVPPAVRGSGNAARSARSRLRLEALDLSTEQDLPLRTSPELISQPSEDAQVRIQAQALWRALNAQPQDVLRDAQRMQALETDVKALREMFAANQASLTALRGDLQQAREERYANGLVYTLLAAVLGLAAALAWRWHRGAQPRAAREWWRRDDWAGDSLRELEAEAVAEPLQYPDARWPSRPAQRPDDIARPSPARGPDAAATAHAPVPQRAPDDDGASPTEFQAPPPLTDFGVSTTGGVRAMNTEELLDVQQQADFFLSLGQHDQAIELLLNHIEQDSQSSALPYLDLLDIYHQLGQREPYEVLRAEINRVFNADAPAFDGYAASRRELADYPAALSRIENLWPSPKVLAVIEESLFRKPGAAGRDTVERFDLGAYRELLLLYTVARQIIQTDGADDGSGDAMPQFVTTSILPLPAVATRADEAAPAGAAPMLEWVLPDDAAGAAAAEASAPQMPGPAALGEIGLDIDLSSLAPPPEERVEMLSWEDPVVDTAAVPKPPVVMPADDAFDLATDRLAGSRRTPLH